jgi:hypothetical protein
MTRKHFNAIARALADVAQRGQLAAEVLKDPEARQVWQAAHQFTAEVLAAELRAFNPNFDRARFLRACGVEA